MTVARFLFGIVFESAIFAAVIYGEEAAASDFIVEKC